MAKITSGNAHDQICGLGPFGLYHRASEYFWSPYIVKYDQFVAFNATNMRQRESTGDRYERMMLIFNAVEMTEREVTRNRDRYLLDMMAGAR